MITIPTEGKINQPNKGKFLGNIYATYGVDLSTEPGVILTTGGSMKVLDTSDDADFAGYAAAILKYDGDYFAVSDKVFTSASLTSGWAQASTSGDDPDSGNTVMDATVYNNLLLVSTATDIKAWNGTTWSSWWVTTVGGSALSTGSVNGRHLLEVGPQGDLFISDLGQKIYRVTGADTQTVSGNGTLDFSATSYVFRCMEASSSRMWIGTENIDDNEAVIIEWDMSENASTPNRLHRIGSTAVYAIAIWNDTPIAVLRNGKIKYFNGSSFVDWEGAQFPIAMNDNVIVDDFIHNNGWAIIDNLPHFLVLGSILTSGDTFNDNISSPWNMSSGVYCLDPERGLYHRFALGNNDSTQVDFGQPSLKDVGALFAVDDQSSKFLASYDVYSTSSTSTTVLAYQDMAITKPTIAYLATTVLTTFEDTWKNVGLFFKQLSTGDRIDVYYRFKDDDLVSFSGSWFTPTKFNTTSAIGTVESGNYLFIKTGNGAGQLLRIVGVTASSGVNQIEVEGGTLAMTAGETSGVQVLPFKRFQTITSTSLIESSADIPSTEQSHKLQLLFQYRPAAGNKIQQEYCIID